MSKGKWIRETFPKAVEPVKTIIDEKLARRQTLLAEREKTQARCQHDFQIVIMDSSPVAICKKCFFRRTDVVI